MNNIKGIAVIPDGNAKRLLVTYDVVNEAGETTKFNQKTNRILTDSEVLSAVSTLEAHAQSVIDAE